MLGKGATTCVVRHVGRRRKIVGNHMTVKVIAWVCILRGAEQDELPRMDPKMKYLFTIALA